MKYPGVIICLTLFHEVRPLMIITGALNIP